MNEFLSFLKISVAVLVLALATTAGAWTKGDGAAVSALVLQRESSSNYLQVHDVVLTPAAIPK